MMIVDLAPYLDFTLRFLLIFVTVFLCLMIGVVYSNVAIASTIWGNREPVGCWLGLCVIIVLVAVGASYLVF